MRKILLCLSLLPIVASASEIDDAVRDVAESKMSMTTSINEQSIEVVYVGIHKSCDAVSIMWTRRSIENFRVCHGEVQPRNTVSPAWDDKVGRPIFQSVVNNTILYGQAKQFDRNGYLVSARALNSLRHDCKNIEVMVSYDGDLVDRDVHEVCG